MIEREAVCLAIDCDGGGDDAGVGVDLEEVVWVAGQTVGDGVGCGVQVESVGSDANGRANRNVSSISFAAALCRLVW